MASLVGSELYVKCLFMIGLAERRKGFIRKWVKKSRRLSG